MADRGSAFERARVCMGALRVGYKAPFLRGREDNLAQSAEGR